jgi:hypothetical protein
MKFMLLIILMLHTIVISGETLAENRNKFLDITRFVSPKMVSSVDSSFRVGKYGGYLFECTSKNGEMDNGVFTEKSNTSKSNIKFTREEYVYKINDLTFYISRIDNRNIYVSGKGVFGKQLIDDVEGKFSDNEVTFLKGIFGKIDDYNFEGEIIKTNSIITRKPASIKFVGGGGFKFFDEKFFPQKLVKYDGEWFVELEYQSQSKIGSSDLNYVTVVFKGVFLVHLASGYTILELMKSDVPINGQYFEYGSERYCDIQGKTYSAQELGIGWAETNHKPKKPIVSASAPTQSKLTNSPDQFICNRATFVRVDGKVDWEGAPIFEPAVSEAKRRGFDLRDCAYHSNRHLLPVSDQSDVKIVLAEDSLAPKRINDDHVSKTAEIVTRPTLDVAEKPEVEVTDEPMVAAKNANIRDQPNISGAKVAFLRKGEFVNVVGRVKGLNWALVAQNGSRLGFVYAPLLTEKPKVVVATNLAETKESKSSGKIPGTLENKHAVAIIIGNRTYEKTVPAVDFASNDADAMRRFVIEQLGYREGNVVDVRDATNAQLNSIFGNRETHEGKLWQWVRAGKSDVTVFYSGHGVPGLKDRRGYLLPVDADPNRPHINGYPLDLLLTNLSKVQSRSMTVFLDACFSGDSPKGMLVNAMSGISIEARMPKGTGKMTIITAATGEQVASWDLNAKHGLFTLHLLKALTGVADGEDYGNSDGKVTLGEVKRYLDEEMTYAARRQFGREQNASVRGDDDTVLAIVKN